ncbi:MAG: universal stress protein [Chloroflexi bacterium]|nr:universal stress protein [Chloroflexota bacterium]
MSYKDILVYLDDGRSNEERIKTAFSYAETFDARITGVTLASVKPAHLKISDAKARARISEQEAEQRVADFLKLAQKQGVTADSRVVHGELAVAARKMAQVARNFDLVMLRQANPKSKNFPLLEKVAEQVILLSGRPVFFMPYIGAHRIPCKKSMIAWDGTPAATRAVHDALPLLKRIGEVVILVVKEGKQKTAKGELLVKDLASHLIRHHVQAKIKKVNAGTFDVPTVILNEIADNDIDLLVMGGYGTPNLQQKIFGGVTRTLLSSMIIPVVMSH